MTVTGSSVIPAMDEGKLGVIRRKRPRRTIFEVHHWPSQRPVQGHVCSSRCNHDDAYFLADGWTREDAEHLRRRIKTRRGGANGRVLYFVARPPLYGGQSLQREGAALLSRRN